MYDLLTLRHHRTSVPFDNDRTVELKFAVMDPERRVGELYMRMDPERAKDVHAEDLYVAHVMRVP